MNKHDTQHSEAARLARYAARARAAGDIAGAQKYETRALTLVGALPSSYVTEWGQRGRRAVAAAIVGMATLALPLTASAAPKKPSVCAVYELVTSKAGKPVALCYDGKRPKAFDSFTFADVRDPETGAVARFLVGY